ncbi:ATP-binding protein [Chlorobium sp. KB01]|uniref:ATP-binding protein n=1 Tax=Chlorobium sp. KB01 TaxID=1917528 RepID=UPI0009783934|nr:ATP-binding protein [Chlorobium sp. KB01]
MIIERSQKAVLAKRIESEPRRFIQVLHGPRQVGKTTLARQFMQATSLPVHFASADLVAAGQSSWITQQWETARLKLSHSGKQEALLVIDEIQKISNWSEAVKREWDADTANNISLKVILLGSSRLLLQQGLTESLAGRFETVYIGHWSFGEMKKAFDFTPEQYVWFGGYPGAAALIADESRWSRYVAESLIETSISKDILMLTRVDKPALMKRLFELGCSYSGQILSYTKMLGQLQDAGNTTTLSHYLRLLDTAGLLGGLEKYSPESLRQKSSSPKFQVHNTALVSAQQQLSFDTVSTNPAMWGRWVESAIGAHLLNHTSSDALNLFYWRQGNHEVDFVLVHSGKVIGVEIKSGHTQRASGMEAFRRQYNPDKVLLVGNSGIPWQEFLQIDPRELFA